MKPTLLIHGLSAILAAGLFITSPSHAKTAKACEDEWKANKTTIQAAGTKKKDFIVQCRADTAAATPAPAPSAATPSGAGTTASPAETGGAKKTVKACQVEWKANKAAIQAGGKKKADFMTECRAQPAAVRTTAVPSQSATDPKSEASAPPPPARSVSRESEARTNPAPAAPAATLANGQFNSESAAKVHCPGDTVVWANTRSKIYHYATSRQYGHTKAGAYMCEKETASAGIRAAKREKRS